MNVAPPILRFAAIAAVFGVLLPPVPGESQTSAPIVRPGAPGESSRLISTEDAARLAGIRHSEADVRFVQEMIAHHAQALEMTALVAERSDREAMRQLAGRIEGSQGDEIRMMQDWLRDRDLAVPAADTHHAHAGHVPGMLTAEDMRRLEQARGIDFDRLFLQLMIQHHRGAITMVQQLLAQPGAAQDSQLFAFTSDVTADQSAEIARMERVLRGLSIDPRAHLTAGFRDAGEAAWNMALVATRPTPDGFFVPTHPRTGLSGLRSRQRRIRRTRTGNPQTTAMRRTESR